MRGRGEMLLTAAILAAALVGLFAIHRAHERQWHVRCLREIRALPECLDHEKEPRP